MKKILLIMIVGIFTFGLATGCGKDKKEEEKKKEEEIKANTSADVIKDQEIGVFKMENTSLVYDKGTTAFETTVTNTSSEDKNLTEFKIIVKDEKGKEMITLTGYVGSVIKAGETKIINSYCGEDLTKAKSVEYIVID